MENSLIVNTACVETVFSLMQIPSKTTEERHGHEGKSLFLLH